MVAGLGVPAHQRQVGILVGRVDGHQVGPASGLAQQLEVADPQPFPQVLGPGLVEIVREEVTPVQHERALGGRRRAVGQGGLGGTIQLQGVDGHRAVGEQRHGVALHDDGVRRPRGPPREVGGLVEPGRGLVGTEVGPERVEELLAVKAASRGERQQLDQRGGVPAAPRARRRDGAVDLDLEAPQQPDHDRHPPEPPPIRPYRAASPELAVVPDAPGSETTASSGWVSGRRRGGRPCRRRSPAPARRHPVRCRSRR